MKKLIIALLLSFACTFSVFAQQTLTVSGTVKDDAGEPLIGVVVAVAGTGNAAVTDLDGNYTLTKVPAGAKLEASCLGYTNVTKPAAEKVDFVLSTSTEMLSEAVVTGMTTTDKRLFTGATDQLSAVDVNISGVGEVSRSLEGKSAGVSVQNVSGTFGTAPKIRVRGATSIFGDSKPLWVVDGVIMEDVVNVDANSLSSGDATTLISSAIAGLNSDDIESFQILKDGSATSIYGARAMAGVIVVTTKKGTPGVTRVNYNGEYTMRLVPSYSEFNIMNSQEIRRPENILWRTPKPEGKHISARPRCATRTGSRNFSVRPCSTATPSASLPDQRKAATMLLSVRSSIRAGRSRAR